MKRTHTIKTLVTFAITLLLASVVRVDAQADNWRVVSSTTDASGTVTIVERAEDGRTRTTTRRFFRSKPMAVESENAVIQDRDGNRTGTVYGRWNFDGNQIAWGEEFYNAGGYTVKGNRWRFEEENGRIIEPRINEIFDERTKKWKPIGPRFEGVFRNKFGHIYGIRIDGDQVTIATAEQVGESNKFIWSQQANENFRRSKTKLMDRGLDTTIWSACGDADTGNVSGAIDRPAKLIFGDNGWTFEIVIRDGDCVDGKPYVGNGWVKLNDLPFFADKFYRVSDLPPAEAR